ncbi:hypothetical protein BAUCODRAFT_33740 [Baudoinia panamericana UAMH 10762]|uniref:Calcineurin-like phosphoesterase domain-containing protein n=1 Tax=Baudoinia panamericana (strain UAMH 10762) TaxID=717646 RepID=M2LPT1_BAUPA|nr:uncharacterized protein BAUCODRAFT_33740 [Baudoinia panamericana UAMH 10762]EMC96412.1 hypothetical protein BAUCODRAFT_33740 [Baudoinia panamericana UAMH 10762]
MAQQALAQAHYAGGYPGAVSYVAPAGYPTSVFSSYYAVPSGQEPQPALYDPVLNITYPRNLTNPDTIPTNDPDPIYLPQPIANLTTAQQQLVIDNVLGQIGELINGTYITGNCSKCIAALSVAKSAAQLAPALVPAAMVQLCTSTGFHSASTCAEDFAADTFGAIWTQILALADVSGLDGQYICNSLSSSFCAAPPVSPLNTTGLFTKPKPANATAPPASGQRVKVLHMSDFHLDPRYKVGSEGNCSSGLCCRSNVANSGLRSGQISYPAPAYGSYLCDTPYDLGLAALQAVAPLTGTCVDEPLAWTVYTGDLVAHDPQSQLSRAFTEYSEESIYYMFSKYLTGPVFPALGNHDTNPEAIDAPYSMPGNLSQQQSWNYDHVASLWQLNGWLNATAAQQARTHYGAYSVKNHYGLRIITFNTDFWYHSNFLNFINTSNPDVSGTFKFMIQELQAAEDAGEQVWIIGHVLSGWDGSNPIVNPTNLFYQIVDRYSPHVIRNIFFGHTHEDEVMIYYANNATNMSLGTALSTGWVGPSVTPLTNLNSGFRMYEVDTGSFDIYDAYTWYADVSSFPSLVNSSHGPTFQFEYSTRDTYGPAANWPATAPLNATFWHAVTMAMETNPALVNTFNKFEGKSSNSGFTTNCTCTGCVNAKICYMRSGSAALGRACPQGFSSVQSAFTGKC